jgi:hypothetical protein
MLAGVGVEPIHLPPSDFTVFEDAEIESRTVATSALTARHSNHSTRHQSYLLKNFLLVYFFKFLATQKPRSGLHSKSSESEYDRSFKDQFSVLQKAQATYLRTELSVFLHSSLLIMVTLPSRRSPQVPLSVFPKP